MALRRDREVKPINFPKRGTVIGLRTGADARQQPTPHRVSMLTPSAYVDPRRQGQKKVRLDFEATTNPLRAHPKYLVSSPDDAYIEIDSANEIVQVYTLPPANVAGCQFLRPIVDPVNNLLITYHFDRTNLRWVKFVTRLRKDLTFPRPPAGQLVTNYVPYYGSRGTRYVRTTRRLAIDPERRHSISDRIFFGDRSGVSGARGMLGAFR